jgi:succinate-semialdehyde dehydrogenase/glutarate-semialdehyde dehydrogenase
VDAAHRAFKGWAKTAPRVRGEILRKAFEIMVAESDRLAEIISRENGKVLSDAKGEVLYAAEFFRWFSEEAVRINGEFRTSPSGDKRIIVTKQPIGVSIFQLRWRLEKLDQRSPPAAQSFLSQQVKLLLQPWRLLRF